MKIEVIKGQLNTESVSLNAFATQFANAQQVPTWGFTGFASFSDRPDRKSKFYAFQEPINPWARVSPRRYMVGEHGEQMVRRDPAPKDQPRR
jgi:hypothetical protein